MSTQIASKRKREEKWKEMEKMLDNARLRLHTKSREKTETHMIRKNQRVPFVQETHNSKLQEFQSIDGHSLISSNKSNGRKGRKEKKNELMSLLKRETPLFFLSFFDAVATFLSLPLII